MRSRTPNLSCSKASDGLVGLTERVFAPGCARGQVFQPEERIFIPINWCYLRRDNFWRIAYHFILPPLISFNPTKPQRDPIFPSRSFDGTEGELDPVDGRLTVSWDTIRSGSEVEDRVLFKAILVGGQLRGLGSSGGQVAWNTKVLTYKACGFYELDIVFSSENLYDRLLSEF